MVGAGLVELVAALLDQRRVGLGDVALVGETALEAPDLLGGGVEQLLEPALLGLPVDVVGQVAQQPLAALEHEGARHCGPLVVEGHHQAHAGEGLHQPVGGLDEIRHRRGGMQGHLALGAHVLVGADAPDDAHQLPGSLDQRHRVAVADTRVDHWPGGSGEHR